MTFALRAAGLYVVWLVIDDNVSQPELFAGVLVALLALLLAAVLKRSSSVRLVLRPAMLRFAYRLPMLLVGDSLRVSWALIKSVVLRRPLTGHFRAARYAASGGSPDHVTRQALTEWSASLAPNRYVIGIDDSDDSLLVHELVTTRGPLDPLELG